MVMVWPAWAWGPVPSTRVVLVTPIVMESVVFFMRGERIIEETSLEEKGKRGSGARGSGK